MLVRVDVFLVNGIRSFFSKNSPIQGRAVEDAAMQHALANGLGFANAMLMMSSLPTTRMTDDAAFWNALRAAVGEKQFPPPRCVLLSRLILMRFPGYLISENRDEEEIIEDVKSLSGRR